MADDNDFIRIFRENEGGIGKVLSEDQKQGIMNGRQNHPEKKTDYDLSELEAGADAFFANHSLHIE
jgi:hypothetical protein